jgi:hypothetical protein
MGIRQGAAQRGYGGGGHEHIAHAARLDDYHSLQMWIVG